jgi:DNA mismatch repair ATPase MutS
MLINWEGISEDPEGSFFRHRGPSGDYMEVRRKSRDLEIDYVAYDAESSHDARMESLNSSSNGTPFLNYSSPTYISNMLRNPFIDQQAILQIHDSVEELVENPGLLRKIDGVISTFKVRYKDLVERIRCGQLTQVEFGRRALQLYHSLGNSPARSDSRLLRDISEILRSRRLRDSPVREYDEILSSGEIKVVLDNSGFELHPSNEDIQVNHQERRFFTKGGGSIMEMCIGNSVQAERAHQLLSGTESFLGYLGSIASYVLAMNLKKPSFTQDNSLRIDGGYHPLLKSEERNGNGVVHHDLRLDERDKVLALTGPNAGGKSTYIKELALTSMLAQAGFFVPADLATLPVYEKFLTHFGRKDSLLEDLSLFQAEIEGLSRNLGDLEDRTLFVCDELFKGTESGERGGSLLHQAVVEALLTEYPGRVLLSSHYHGSLSKQTDLPGIRLMRADVDRDGNPTYGFSEGVDGGGYAVCSAVKAGLPRQVTGRLGLSEAEISRLTKDNGKKPHPIQG